MMRKDQPEISHQRDPQSRCRLRDAGQHRVIRLRMLERDREQVALEDAKHDRRIAGVLHDLLPPAVFPRHPAELRNDRRQQLQHDRRADVRHDA